MPASIRPLGDAAVLVDLGGTASPEEATRVRALTARIVAAFGAEPGWGALVPGASSVLIPVDPLTPGADAAAARLRELLAAEDVAPAPAPDAATALEPLVLRTRYGGVDGPDLEAVAAMTGLAPADVIARHAAPTYTTLFLGFAPGFGYLGPLDPAIRVPRKGVPLVHVPVGSVAIAGPQTAIYPLASPGGWWILGRTDAVLWDPRREPPALLAPGRRVRFEPA